MRRAARRKPLPLYKGFLAGWGATTFGTGLVLPLMVAYLREALGLPTSGVSLYFALFAMAGLVVNPLAGKVGKLYGPGLSAVGATVLQAAGAAWLAAADSMASTMPAACLSGAGTGAYYAVQTPLLTKVFGTCELSRVLSGQHRVSALTVAVGALLGGQAVEHLGEAGYALCLVANAVSYLLHGAVLVRLRRVERRPAEPGTDGAGSAVPRDDGGDRGTALRDRVFLRLLLMQTALVVFGLAQVDAVVPAILRNADLSVSAISVVVACNTVGVIAFQGLALRVIERIGYVAALTAAILVWVVAMGALTAAVLVPGTGVRLLFGALFGLVFAVGECLIAPSVQPLVTLTAPPARLESYAAATSLAHGLGAFLAPLVLLPVVDGGGVWSYLALQLGGYGLALYALLSFRGRSVRRLAAAPPSKETTP
ncbi:MFS transporter [Streptomyces antarcticus]|uniref:MFS transporter n=1 Tax=Streptomyces antarcticus TaxID=2996458 RepID=UPI00226D7CCE|nr:MULTISPECIES: MFS transporter [unclassified Streptomyces]MCY0941033.1 MFS transporter [Streptomyces sp. H34-AA3]MCZ4085573.1 MFS transporter [Streptomyces sp. H34-S5]